MSVERSSTYVPPSQRRVAGSALILKPTTTRDVSVAETSAQHQDREPKIDARNVLCIIYDCYENELDYIMLDHFSKPGLEKRFLPLDDVNLDLLANHVKAQCDSNADPGIYYNHKRNAKGYKQFRLIEKSYHWKGAMADMLHQGPQCNDRQQVLSFYVAPPETWPYSQLR